MLEVGAVEHAGGQDHHGGIVDAGGRRLPQGGQEPAGVLLDRTDELLAESLRQALGHGPAVLEDVADARGHTHVVLQDPERALGVADDVDSGNVDPDAAGRLKPVHLAVEVRARRDELARDDAVGDHGHLVVDVIEEGFKGADALGHTAFQDAPLIGGDHAGDDVQGEGPFLTREVEGHAAVQEGPGHGIGAGADVSQREFAQGQGHLPVGSPGLLAGGKHLVVGAGAAGGLGVFLE